MAEPIRALDVPARTTTIYPAPYAATVAGRAKRALGDLFGLSQFGVNLTVLAPGSSSAERHWHETEDEFVFILEGEAVLIDDQGEHVLGVGMCAVLRPAFPTPTSSSIVRQRPSPSSRSAHGARVTAPIIPRLTCWR